MNSRRIWVTIGGGVVGIAEGDRNGFPRSKPRGFPMPDALLEGGAELAKSGSAPDEDGAELAKSGSATDEDGAELALLGKHEELADFIVSCLARYAANGHGLPRTNLNNYNNKNSKSKRRAIDSRLCLLLGYGAAFYREYKAGSGSTALRAEQRAVALDGLTYGGAPQYIIEDIGGLPRSGIAAAYGAAGGRPRETSSSNGAPYDAASGNVDGMLHRLYGDFAGGLYIDADAGVSTSRSTHSALHERAVFGTDYRFLAGLIKCLRRRGCRADYATSAQAAARVPAERAGRLPDLMYGGREKRRFGRMLTALCVCTLAVALFVAAWQPIQAWRAESGASALREASMSGEDAAYYEQLKNYRQLQSSLPAYEGLASALGSERTGYGGLFELLRSGVLSGAPIKEMALGDDGSILVSFTTKDIASFESALAALNDSRMMSAAEVAPRARVSEGKGKSKSKAWRIQLKLSYFTFGGAHHAEGGAAS
ncbi:MAG: hypothetical protein LBG82_03245 [Clostridiales Family XIII bacterium]|nr:hypothetical protein [Clostridiales Family XIII bacterium]